MEVIINLHGVYKLILKFRIPDFRHGQDGKGIKITFLK